MNVREKILQSLSISMDSQKEEVRKLTKMYVDASFEDRLLLKEKYPNKDLYDYLDNILKSKGEH